MVGFFTHHESRFTHHFLMPDSSGALLEEAGKRYAISMLMRSTLELIKAHNTL
jgi:hypothetical protein